MMPKSRTAMCCSGQSPVLDELRLRASGERSDMPTGSDDRALHTTIKPDEDKQTRSQSHNCDKISVRAWRRTVRVLLALYIAGLAGLAYWCSLDATRWESLTWRPDNAIWIVQVIGQIGSGVARDLLFVLGLSFLSGAACAPGQRRTSLIWVLVSSLVAFGLSLATALLLGALLHSVSVAASTFPAILLLTSACLWGSWLGVTWMRCGSSIGWLFQQFVLALVIVCGALAVLVWLALSSEPLEITSVPVSTDDRRRLVAMFREHDPRDLQVEQTIEMPVTERDLNQLASWGLSLLPGDHRARLRVGGGEVSLKVSFQLPANPVLPRYANLSAAGRPVVRVGELGFSPSTLELGRLSVPRGILRLTGPLIIDSKWQNDATGPFLRSLRSVDIDESLVRVSYGRLDIEKGFVHDALVGLGMLENLETATVAQVNRLVALAERNSEPTFAQCIETAFDEAKKRSKEGDAARENRAALLALGYLLGHSKIGAFLGSKVPEPSAEVQRRFRCVTLRDRRDWTRHYTVSAAFQVLSNAAASMDVGVLKEELDADGGSGFSFGDLLADRAGTMLAVRATESGSAAVAMQNRLTQEIAVANLMPDGSDLPEGLSDSELKTRYDGVGGRRYRQMLAEIDQRIESCSAYEPAKHRH